MFHSKLVETKAGSLDSIEVPRILNESSSRPGGNMVEKGKGKDPEKYPEGKRDPERETKRECCGLSLSLTQHRGKRERDAKNRSLPPSPPSIFSHSFTSLPLFFLE